MFSSDNKKSKYTLSMETSTQQNIIAQGTKIVGDIASEGPFRIDGTPQKAAPKTMSSWSKDCQPQPIPQNQKDFLIKHWKLIPRTLWH